MILAIRAYLRFEVTWLRAGQEEVIARGRQRQLRRRARAVNGIVLRGDTADAHHEHDQTHEQKKDA